MFCLQYKIILDRRRSVNASRLSSRIAIIPQEEMAIHTVFHTICLKFFILKPTCLFATVLIRRKT